MTTPRDADETAARHAAIDETAGSANHIFDPDYLERLRQEWPD